MVSLYLWRLQLSHLSPDFFQISYMNYFYQTLTKSEWKYCPMNDNKMAAKMAAFCRFALQFSYLSPDFFQITYNISITFIKLFPKINCGYCPMNFNQDGCSNGHRLSVCTCGHSNLVIYHPIYSKFHIWTTSIKLLCISEYGFVRWTIIKIDAKTDISFSLRALHNVCGASCQSPTVLVNSLFCTI